MLSSCPERFASFPMDETHRLAAARCVEMNPVAAGLSLEQRPCSSGRQQRRLCAGRAIAGNGRRLEQFPFIVTRPGSRTDAKAGTHRATAGKSCVCGEPGTDHGRLLGRKSLAQKCKRFGVKYPVPNGASLSPFCHCCGVNSGLSPAPSGAVPDVYGLCNDSGSHHKSLGHPPFGDSPGFADIHP